MKRVSLPSLAVMALITIVGVTGLLLRTGADNRSITRRTALMPSRSNSPDSCCIPEDGSTAMSGNSLYQLRSEWTDQDGNRVQLSHFQNRPVVLAMFYSHCTYACPVTINDMKIVEAALPAEVKNRAAFVLVSFDPARDTPQKLHSLAQQRGLDDGSWELLTGKRADIRTLAEMLGVEFKMQADGSFIHSSQITVLNDAGEIIHKHFGLNEPIGDVVQATENASLQSRSAGSSQIDQPDYK